MTIPDVVVVEDTEPVSATSRKRVRSEVEGEPRKKGRSIFGQAFGTLKKARKENVVTEAVGFTLLFFWFGALIVGFCGGQEKKRIEIDTRIMGRITKEQSTTRKQEEAKKDRISATRKEEDIALKDAFVSFRSLLPLWMAF